MKNPAFLLALILASSGRAQTINAFQHPPDMRWKKIDTPHYEIVFPQELAGEGQRVAGLMEALYGPHNRTLNADRKRYSIFLSNRGAYANGYVALAPRKSVWFHQPMQGTTTGSGEWITLLAAHEGRHMAQFDKANTGFTRLAGRLFGETGLFGLSMFSIPLWWWEGDAVGMETAMTRGGRGRIPEFNMGTRTQLTHDIRHSYQKSYLGSYRDWTPNWYELGYHLVSHVKQACGPSAWDAVIRRTSKWSFWPFAFSNALKKETGINPSRLYSETMAELEEAWKKQLPDSTFPPYRILNKKPSSWTKYRFPQYQDDGTVIAQKWGYDFAWSLVVLDGFGNERTLKQIYPLEPNGTKGSAAAGKIAWDETVPDPRWGMKSLPCIVVMDVRTKKTRRLPGEHRYFNPSLSPDGRSIAAVEFETDRTCALVVLDAESGRLLKRMPSPDNALLQAPSWSPDGRKIVFTFQDDRGKGISVFTCGTGETREVLPPGWEGISHPVLFDRWVLFSSPGSGIDNIHAVDTENGTEYQVTSLPCGAFSPQVSSDGKELLFSCYSPEGMNVCETGFNPSAWIRPDPGTVDAAGYARTLTVQENGPMAGETAAPKTARTVQDYRPFSRLLNVHSWLPVFDTNEIGLMLRSNDRLNTASFAFGPVVNTNENKTRFEVTGAYAGLFPVIEFSLSGGGRGAAYEDDRGGRWTDSWTETSAGLGLGIPLDLSRGIMATRFQAGLGASFTKVSGKSVAAWGDQFNGDLADMHYRLLFSRFRDGALRDAAPRHGQVFTAGYRHTPFRTDYRGSQFFSQAALFLPGFMKHHGLSFRAAWEEQGPGNYLFATSFYFSRGYGSVFHEKFAYASASYTLPLLYPDLAMGGFAYLKRVRGRLFYDHTLGKDGKTEFPYRSTGAEIGFETHFFNIPVPIDAGVRWAHRIEDGKNRVEPFVFLDLL